MKRSYKNSIANSWKNLYFSKTEKWSLSILSLILLSIICIKVWIGQIDTTKQQSFGTLDSLIAEVEKLPYLDQNERQKVAQSLQESRSQSARNRRKKEVILSPFDPNTSTLAELRKLGIPTNVAYTIINFRKSGFEFRTKNDFSRVYGIDTSLFSRLSPYISLPDNLTAQPSKYKEDMRESWQMPLASIDLNSATIEEFKKIKGIGNFYSSLIVEQRFRIGGFDSLEQLDKIEMIPDSIWPKIKPYLSIDSQFEPSDTEMAQYAKLEKRQEIELASIEINSASKEEIQTIRGIGDFYSSMIVKYRDRSGGFHSLDQLNEIEIIPDSTMTKAKQYLKIEVTNIQKRNINDMSFDSLYRHPYITFNEASVIKKYLHHHGPLKDIEELSQIAILDTSQVALLSKYFTTEK